MASPRAPVVAVPVVEVPNGRLFVATILHGSTIFLGAVLFGGLITAGVLSVGPLALAGVPAMLPAAFFIVLGRGKEMLTHGNFRLVDVGTGVRVTEGLTDLRTMTIPLNRVQALEVIQPIGGACSAGGGCASTSPGWAPRAAATAKGSRWRMTLLPVGTLDDALRVLTLLAPRVPASRWNDAVLGEGPQRGWQTASARAKPVRSARGGATALVGHRRGRPAASPGGSRGAPSPCRTLASSR